MQLTTEGKPHVKLSPRPPKRIHDKSLNRDGRIRSRCQGARQLEEARLTRYCAGIEKNLGYLYFCVNDFSKAHAHLDRARDLYFSLNDRKSVAQVDDTKARVFLSQGNSQEAERLTRSAVRTLSRSGEQVAFTEALTTRGVALARIGKRRRSLNTFHRAIHISEVAGELEVAARARLSIIEEFYAQVPATDLVALFRSALNVLACVRDDRIKQRMFACGMRVIEALHSQARPFSDEVSDWENFSLRDHIIHCERVLIERALRDSGGVVSRAARLLGFKHHQSLITLLNHRHKDLLAIRSAIRPRTRSVVHGRQIAAESQGIPKIQILHVEHNDLLAKSFRDYTTLNNWIMTRFANAESAIEELRTHAHYDLLIFDFQLPGMNGIELVRRTRKISQRRRTPIIMFSEVDCETRAWQAGVDAFLRKGADTGTLQSMIKRLLRPA